MRTIAVIAAAAALITWRFMRAWHIAWAEDAADWIRVEARDYSTEYND